MKKNLLGILFTFVLSSISMLLSSKLFPAIESLTIGIVLGMLYGNILEVHEKLEDGVKFSYKTILKWGIVLLGLKLNFKLIFELGPVIAGIIVTIISLALILAYALGKKLGIKRNASLLVGVGSSVCGASAIVAMGPVIDADEEDVTTSVAVISILGALGVIAFSALSKSLPITDLQYGVWAGTSLQGVAHAIAAAGARGTESIGFDVGVLVKMARVAMLGPVALVLGSLANKGNSSKRTHFPMYVILFLIMGVINSINMEYSIIPTVIAGINIIDLLIKSSNMFILMSMVAMGLRVNLKKFEREALKSLVLGIIVFLTVSCVSYGLIHLI